jgi:DNA-binding transcriptional LysR family regulator
MSQIDEWKVFVKVVEAESFSRAAERLGIAKSVVSRRIADLETRLGAQLLTRTTRRLGITLAGRDFYERCVRMLADIHEMEASVRNTARVVSGRLKIAVPNAFGTRHLAPVLAGFAARHPGVELDLDASDRMVDLVAEGFDLAVRIGRLADSSLIVRRLAPSRFTVTASAAYWRRHGTPQHPDELASHIHIRDTLSPFPGRLEWRRSADNQGHIQPPHKIKVSSGDFALELAIADLGFVVGPSFLSHRAIASGSLIPVLTGYSWSASAIHVVYPPTRHRSAKVRAVVDYLADAFAGEPPWDLEIAKTIGVSLVE